jgi:hypothetical protein
MVTSMTRTGTVVVVATVVDAAAVVGVVDDTASSPSSRAPLPHAASVVATATRRAAPARGRNQSGQALGEGVELVA